MDNKSQKECVSEKKIEKKLSWWWLFLAVTGGLVLVLVLFGIFRLVYGGITCEIDWMAETKPWMLFTGVAVAPSLIVTWIWREQHRREDVEKGKNDIEIARLSLFSERYNRAVEQLGSENLFIRLGAIYSLKSISDESKKHHWQVVKILATFIRETTPWPPTDSKLESLPTPEPEPEPDIHAAFTALCERKHKDTENYNQRVGLAKTDLRGVSIERCNMKNLLLSGANMESSILLDVNMKNVLALPSSLKNSILLGCKFDKIDSLVEINFEGARYNSLGGSVDHLGYFHKCEFPEGFNPEEQGMKKVEEYGLI